MIIGITGTNGAGKSVLAKYLTYAHGAKYFSVRSFLEQQLPDGASRDDLVDRANMYRERYGGSYIVKKLLSESKDCDLAVVESIRTMSEVDYLRILKGKLFAVDAPQDLRYERIIQRASSTDVISFKEFCSQEVKESFNTNASKQNISACMRKADHTFMNISTRKKLYTSVDRIMKQYRY